MFPGDESMESAVAASVASVAGDVRYSAVARLAVEYARALDSGQAELTKAGTQLLAVLDAMALTPKATGASTGGSDDGPVRSPLDELRARRRQRNAEAGDSAAS